MTKTLPLLSLAAAAVAGVAYLATTPLATAQDAMTEDAPTTQPADDTANAGSTEVEGGTTYTVLQQPGDAQSVEAGDVVFIHYTGRLTDGTEFDSSLSRMGRFGFPEPLAFKMGAGNVIPGMENGVMGMKIGEKRRLTIPADQGYGDRAVGPIPAGSTLQFDVELVGLYRDAE